MKTRHINVLIVFSCAFITFLKNYKSEKLKVILR